MKGLPSLVSGNILRNASSILLGLLFLSGSQMVGAFGFVPTEAEFLSWSYECQRIYSITEPAIANGIGRNMSLEEQKKWGHIGKDNGGLWHYCEGLVKIRRAEMATDTSQKEGSYKEAIRDIMYCYRQLPKSNPWMAPIGVALARVYRGLGSEDDARRFLDDVLKYHPKYVDAYTLYAMLYFGKGDYKTAKEYLLKGNEESGGGSSEVLYFLGLATVELGELDEARKYESEAARLGYPLKGLSEKIKALEKNRPMSRKRGN